MRQNLGWFVCVWAAFALVTAHAEKAPPLITVSDSINPGSGDYIIQSIHDAETDGAPYLILQLDTPGGLLSTTRSIVQQMLNSKIPIVVYVGPRGAHAGSAGALLTFAADVAVMAPGTNIGAAHPVTPGGNSPDKTMAEKMANDTAAFAEGLARAKGRNTQWAIKAVRDSASIIAEDALKQNVIDFMAEDISDLEKKLSGYKLKVAKAGVNALPAAATPSRPQAMTLKHRLLSFFSDPNLAYLIMSLGGLCLWIELSHPGLLFPGVLGAVCILLSLISFQLLPISYGALGLIFFGMGMIVAELFLPAYGLLGLGGIAAFIVGSIFLMDTHSPEFQISLGLILPTAAVLAAAAFGLAVLVIGSRRTQQRSGIETLVGQFAEVKDPVSEREGKVFVAGELWNAITEGESLAVGEIVVVTAVRDMLLLVRKR